MQKRLTPKFHHLMLRLCLLFYRQDAIEKPIFIIGCGRSGTTILADMLKKHRQLAVLNEPRAVWRFEPCTDIWTKNAVANKGSLKLMADDVHPHALQMIRRAFSCELRLQRGKSIVEKLPVNCFRIEFISAIFPDALFVHLIRNGIEVAASIEKFAKRGLWYGHKGIKWQLLADYAKQNGEGHLVDLCSTDYLKGLFEWRLSVSNAMTSFKSIPKDRILDVRYKQLLEDPVGFCEQLEEFIGIERNERMRAFAGKRISRKSKPADMTSLTPEMDAVAGDLLKQLGYL